MKLIKRLFLCANLALCSVYVSAYDFMSSQICYTIVSRSDRTCEVTGVSSNQPSGDVKIPATVYYASTGYTVVGIGKSAFSSCTKITSITLPESVTSIGEAAFRYCTKLTSINIPMGVTSIGRSAFDGCSSLESMDIHEGMTCIGSDAFKNCTSLTSITIPGSITDIELGAFAGCTSLTEVNFNATNCTSAGQRDDDDGSTKEVFINCTNLSVVNIGENVTNIPSYLFAYCTALKSITIPESVVGIGKYSFAGCTSLKSVVIGNGAEAMDDHTFQDCTSLRSVVIGNGVTYIGCLTFDGCTNLQSIVVDDGNPNYRSVDGVLYTKDMTELVRFPQNSPLCWNEYEGYDAYEIPDAVTTIGSYAFDDCTSLMSITIPKSVTCINDYAFRGCTRLYSFSFSDNVTQASCQAILTSCNIFGIESGYTTNGDFFPVDKDGVATITGLTPGTKNSIYYAVRLQNGSISIHGHETISTKAMNPIITQLGLYPDAFIAIGSYDEGDAMVTETGFTGYASDGEALKLTNLEPETKYYVSYYVMVGSREYTTSKTFTTPAVEFSTSVAKATSNTVALIGAKTNLSDYAMNAGFEWRRYDAPEIMPSTQVACPVIDGELTGTLNGLSSSTYYMYRPYYTSQGGTTYYGDWIAFITADAYVYFEPVVRTYEVSDVTDTSASLKGYAVQGSDAIASQGFEYWAESSAKAVKRASSTDGATKVEVSGQWMTATIKDLTPGTAYSYRAYATTAVGTTYGETQSFATTDPTGIDDTFVEEMDVYEVARYAMDGKKVSTPQKGINIIRYSDGTVKKVFVK